MGQQAELKNQYLTVTVRLPEENPKTQRFDTAAVISQVVLNGRHTFCQPEQLLQHRVNTDGCGLCSEFLWEFSHSRRIISGLINGESTKYPGLKNRGVWEKTRCCLRKFHGCVWGLPPIFSSGYPSIRIR